MGLTISGAVRILLKRVVNDQAFPLELKVPNRETRAAIEESREMKVTGRARFATATNCSMTSKEPAVAQRAVAPRTSDYTKRFPKDWEALSRSGRYDMRRLKEAMLLLIYRSDESQIVFVRAGTHSALFEE